MLELQTVSCGYGAFQAVHELTLSLRPGTITGLLGANGAGKSSTLMCVAGHVARQAGTVLFDGQDISSLAPTERVRRGIAISPEGRRLFKDLTVEDNLRVGGLVQPARLYQQDCDRVIALFPRLGERLKSLAGNLSGGEQQMLAIGRALMTRPRLLMLDEPSLGLAPLLVAEIFDIVRRINRDEGLSVLLVEQNAIAALEVVSHGYLIEGGRIVMHDSADAMKKNPDIQEFYLGGAEGKNFHDIKHYSRRKRWLS